MCICISYLHLLTLLVRFSIGGNLFSNVINILAPLTGHLTLKVSQNVKKIYIYIFFFTFHNFAEMSPQTHFQRSLRLTEIMG